MWCINNCQEIDAWSDKRTIHCRREQIMLNHVSVSNTLDNENLLTL